VSNHPQPGSACGPAAVNPAGASAALEALFPPGVAAAELRTPGDASLLYPAETQVVARAVPKRIGEFAAGRLCARAAMARFGVEQFALRAAHDRQPLWPDALVGSITHTQGFCAAVVGERAHFAGLGIDAERVDAVGSHLWPSICGPDELHWIASLPVQERGPAAALVFCGKEAFYKCQYPLTGEWLSFCDLRIVPVEWGAVEGSFRVEPQRALAVFAAGGPTPLHALRTAYRFHEEFVSAGVTLLR
jgi:4'-phosphopantetheinyl transferase EntD